MTQQRPHQEAALIGNEENMAGAGFNAAANQYQPIILIFFRNCFIKSATAEAKNCRTKSSEI
jgi:hypothetical protein